MADNLLPDRHGQRDFFTCDVFDSFKDDIASMEHPVFSLSKKPDHRMLVYERNGTTIKIKPSYTGLATIFDKDILLYLASSLMNAKNAGETISQIVRFTSYDYIISTNKSLGGTQYKLLQEGLERLNGTLIQTNIKTNGVEVTEEFGLIDKWKIVKEDEQGKAVAIEVKLSDWFFNSILGNAVLSIDKDYFRLRKPTERRLYELARKHCGNQVIWKITLLNLKEKLGITSQLKLFRFNIKKITETNHLPEYNISMEDDVVTFTRKAPPKENKTPDHLPKHVTKKEVEKLARPGESYEQAANRIKGLKAALK
ncbi:replication initiator protein A [methanotrophic endosymbiont of Bathymodiolus puteoserpentis (Logatchev)]|jgi:plasmid replication initiation protein|uniref:replication initiator protein A n=1 Tax=methanotrophic endosymbiont of Bathymodiolus puteoserpentis (Logatchev) TaxID=343235 RepID=UPI0013C639F7|nr:replication initiator protein A [methanotrophic endosymbiont of Bathymodiolus puteoserpentis (Logatchev)]SHE22755.1 Plasmid replication initiator protein [methanotrophic endosymbiont of Bathymodiolus puteoserpentis (Logatchev)]